MSGHEGEGEYRVVDVLRKRVAVLGHILVLGILCPFMAIPVVGEIIQKWDEAKYGEASLDSAGSAH